MKILSIIISSILLFEGVSEKVVKKADKAISIFFNTENITKKIISLDNYSKLKGTDTEQKTVMQLTDKNNKNLGFAVLSKGKGRFDDFDFIVIYNNNLVVKKVKVLKYISSRGAEICSNNWLKQFVNNSQKHEYGKNIDALSGATISAQSIVNEINLINKIMSTLKSEKAI